jgi:hypothetical protein
MPPVLNNKLSLLFGVISLIVGRLVWRNVWTRISEVLIEKNNSLFHFDNTWGARHVICLRMDRKIIWSLD